MSRNVLIGVILFMGHATSASADIIYNYEQRWLYDSQSGLYWQSLQIPIDTFSPDHGTVATLEQLSQLGANMNLPELLGGQYPQPGAYSPPLANVLSFFASNRPARTERQQPNLSLSLVYQYPPSYIPSNPNLVYEFLVIEYERLDNWGAAWLYQTISTVGSYGPGNMCFPERECPASVAAFVVSTVQPVPLPAAAWLLVSGLGALAFRKRRGTCRSPASL